jgi:predicted ATPase/class 3 adenylate cyclase
MAATSDSTTGTQPPPRTTLRSATLTLLFTDIEGSTRLLHELGDAYALVLQAHHAAIRAGVAAFDGREVDTQGDSFFITFERPGAAIACALEIQRALRAMSWPVPCEVRVRMGMHTGNVVVAATGLVGSAVHRAARIMAAGHGGQVLVSAATREVAEDELPEGTTLIDLGEHRLKDFERPMTLFQLAHPDLPSTFPPLVTRDSWRSNLPTQVSPFIGRARDVDHIREHLHADGVRLMTLVGPGGTGKTRLALRVAADESDVRDGALFVDLAPVADVESAVAAIAAVVGAPQSRDEPLVEAVKRRLRDRALLLVLDNLEQLSGAGRMVADLLEACPGLVVLGTSREALHVRGEHLVPVAPLDVPERDAPRTAAGLSRFEAIQLFVERARAVRPDFILTDDNAAAVAAICRRLDGLPLAIELATARLNLFTPEQLRDRLASRLTGVGRGALDLPERQQTLRSTIAWSHQLLDPGEQRLFAVLGMFATIRFEAVEAVAAQLEADGRGLGVDPIEGIASLLDRSLVRRTEDGSIDMLETIREFALETLAKEPELDRVARAAHAGTYARLAGEQRALATIVRGDPATLALVGMIEDLEAAWRVAVASRNEPWMQALFDGLSHAYLATGRYRALVVLIDAWIEARWPDGGSAERQDGDSGRLVELLSMRARALQVLDGYTDAVEAAYARVLERLGAGLDWPDRYLVLRDLARFYVSTGRVEKAVVAGRELLALGDQHEDDAIRLDARLILAQDSLLYGDPAECLALLDASIASMDSPTYPSRSIRVGPDPRISTLTTSGFVLWLMGRPDGAVDRMNRAIELAKDLGPYSEVYALYHSGFLHVWRSEPLLVRERAQALLAILEDRELPVWQALATVLLGVSEVLLGNPEDGLRRIDAAIVDYRGMRTPPIFWPSLRWMHAVCLAVGGRLDEAKRVVDEVAALWAGTSSLPAALLIDSQLAMARGDLEAAGRAIDSALGMASTSGMLMVMLQARTQRTQLLRALGRDDESGELRAVLDRFTEGFETRDLLVARGLLAGA